MQSWNHVEIKQQSHYLNRKFASKALVTPQFHHKAFFTLHSKTQAHQEGEAELSTFFNYWQMAAQQSCYF